MDTAAAALIISSLAVLTDEPLGSRVLQQWRHCGGGGGRPFVLSRGGVRTTQLSQATLPGPPPSPSSGPSVLSTRGEPAAGSVTLCQPSGWRRTTDALLSRVSSPAEAAPWENARDGRS